MARMGLFNPKNAAPDTGGGFREGLIKIVEASFKITQKPAKEAREGREAVEAGPPYPALVLKAVVLDPDTQEPMQTADGEDQTVEIVLGCGNKALDKMHPGQANGPDDDDVEDQGDEVGAEGNTVFVLDEKFRVHPRTGIMVWMQSLEKAGYKQQYLDRMWALDYVGSVFEIATHQEPSEGTHKDKQGNDVPNTIPYKVVKKIVRAGYEKKGKDSKEAKGGKPADKSKDEKAGKEGKQSAGVGNEKELLGVLKPVLEQLSTDLDGTSMSMKAFKSKVSNGLNEGEVNAKLLVPAINLATNEAWLEKNGPKFDISLVDGMVQFGTPSD